MPMQENVELMTEYLPLSAFKAIYVVDLCKSLCEQARAKVATKGWTNVHVVEGDACTWRPPITADLVTFSYSLSSTPLVIWSRCIFCALWPCQLLQPSGY